MTQENKPQDPALPSPPGPLPPPPLNTFWDIAKIVIFVMVWYIASDANKALVAAVDYGKLVEAVSGTGVSGLIQVSWLGAKVGIVQGILITAQALVTIWAGPTVFAYLGPVLVAAFRTPIALLIEFRNAWKAQPRDKRGDEPEPEDPNKS